MTGGTAGGLMFTKGHGTENDFVVVPDLDDAWDPTAEQVAAICDRHAGIGADGVLRVVPNPAAGAAGAAWFMDYRNADGSVAEMCGNGIRVFVAYLLREGLVDLADGETVAVATRAGIKHVRRVGEEFAAELGPWQVRGEVEVTLALAGARVPLPALHVDLGNPHAVVVLPGDSELEHVDLAEAPLVDPPPAQGINVEVVVPEAATEGVGRLRMRVHERGVGETRSCGTGVAAAALAVRAWAGAGDGEAGRLVDAWTVDVPGGRLGVQVAGSLRAGDSVVVTGPAVLVADGQFSGTITLR